MNIELKKELVELVKDGCNSSGAVFIVNVQGLLVSEIQGFRKEIRSSGGKVKVFKARIIKRAFRDLGYIENSSELEDVVGGQVALVFAGQDPSVAAKAAVSFAKDNKKDSFVVGGVYKDFYMDLGKVTALSKIPPYEVLVQTLAGTLNAPMTNVAKGLNEIVSGLARALSAAAKKV